MHIFKFAKAFHLNKITKFFDLILKRIAVNYKPATKNYYLLILPPEFPAITSRMSSALQ